MSASTTPQPMTDAEFLATLGVNVQISQGVSDYSNAQAVIDDLKYLNIWNLRDGYNPYWLNDYATVAAAGAKFDFLTVDGGNQSASSIQSFLSGISAVARAVPGSIAAVEGPNEINNWPLTWTGGVTGLQAGVDYQQSLYSQARADSSLPGVAVYYFTGYNAGPVGVGPNPATTAGLANYDTQHPYPNNGNPPERWVNRTQALGNETPPTGPAVYTETGYSFNQVSQQVQAKYTLDLLMDDARNGIARTYLFQLMNDGDGYGLYTSGNQPTGAATAIHNLTTILADSGNAASVRPVGFTLSGLPSDGYDMELVKSTGASDIVVWAEPQISGNASGPTQNVTVRLNGTYQTVKVFDPLTGSSATQTLGNVSSVTLGVTDHPLIVEVEPNSGATPPVTTPPVTTPPVTPSPNGTIVTQANQSVTDASGNRWTLVGSANSGLQVALNNTVISNTSNVVKLEYYNGDVWQLNTSGNWYYWNNANDPVADYIASGKTGPTTTPAPVTTPPVTPSPNGTIVTQANQSITDASGNRWSLVGSANSGLQIALNNTVISNTSNVVKLEYYNGDVWQLNTSGNWYYWKNANDPVANYIASGKTGPVPATVPDVLALRISEDAWKGDAQFTVKVDGRQVGGVETASVLHSSGDSGVFLLSGEWGQGQHDVQVSFINDAYGGSPQMDRNLYVNSIAYDGTTYANTTAALMSNGTDSFTVGGGTPAAAPSADTLTVRLAEDAWLGNADFTLSIDGRQISTPQPVTALHKDGAWEDFSFTGTFGAGAHTLGITFTNDAYSGSSGTERNLYVGGVSVDGQSVAGGTAALMSDGTATFRFTTAHY